MQSHNSPAAKRYKRRMFPTLAAYIVSVFGVALAFKHLNLSGPIAWALAVLPALPILAVLAIMGLYLKEESDEFQRKVLVEAMLWGAGLMMAVMTVWGFLEIYAHAPKLPSFWAFPFFCMGMGLSQPIIRRRYQ